MIDETFLTTEEVLEYLQVNLRTVYRLIKAGKIPAVRVGRQWRFRKRDIDAWLDERVRKVEVEGQQAVLEELAPSEIDIHPLLTPKNIWLDVPPQPRDELLTWMVTRAALEEEVDRQALYESIRARELVCSTALVRDAAFPHPNEPAAFRFSKKRILLAVLREPVSFHDLNGHRPRVIVVILARTVQGYLLTISRAVKLFGNATLIGRIVRAGTAAELIGVIRDAEERLTASAAR
jgi:nitrogen PTS system EIIA component